MRTLRILAEVSLVAAEDTRTASVFLRHHGLHPRLLSYTDHNKSERIPQILQRLAEADVALVSDAGTPAISDPGVDLVAAAREAGHEVVALPGPSAVVAALSVAGLRCNDFRFVGFLPRARASCDACCRAPRPGPKRSSRSKPRDGYARPWRRLTR